MLLAVIVLHQGKTAQQCEFLIDVKVENDLLMLFTFLFYRILNGNRLTSIPYSFVQELTALQYLLALT